MSKKKAKKVVKKKKGATRPKKFSVLEKLAMRVQALLHSIGL